MTRHGTVLPIPDDPRIPELVAAWPDYSRWPLRSRWLREVELLLRQFYPASNARDLNLTARSIAPFYLAQRDWL